MNKLPDPVATATREQGFALVVAGIAAGLPIPTRIEINHHQDLYLYLGDDAPGQVWAWVTHLGMPDPAASGYPLRATARWFESFASEVSRFGQHPALPGWSVRVESFITVNAPAGQVTR